eukprot:7391953-Prymnesium_polylepis.3
MAGRNRSCAVLYTWRVISEGLGSGEPGIVQSIDSFAASWASSFHVTGALASLTSSEKKMHAPTSLHHVWCIGLVRSSCISRPVLTAKITSGEPRTCVSASTARASSRDVSVGFGGSASAPWSANDVKRWKKCLICVATSCNAPWVAFEALIPSLMQSRRWWPYRIDVSGLAFCPAASLSWIKAAVG